MWFLLRTNDVSVPAGGSGPTELGLPRGARRFAGRPRSLLRFVHAVAHRSPEEWFYLALLVVTGLYLLFSESLWNAVPF
jgi:hypothetical protein